MSQVLEIRNYIDGRSNISCGKHDNKKKLTSDSFRFRKHCPLLIILKSLSWVCKGREDLSNFIPPKGDCAGFSTFAINTSSREMVRNRIYFFRGNSEAQ